MRLHVMLFASWADALRSQRVELDMAEGATAADVLTVLERRAGPVELPRPALAVNRSIAPLATRLSAGDEIAVIPPVSGG